MQIHNLVQGSPEWHEFRLNHFGASEAAPMLGLSKKVKRTELLHMKHTGIAKEFNDWLQKNILDKGHEVEALARPIIEKMIDDDLYPVTCSEGMLSASCDGLTMSYVIAFEHKQWNTEYADMVRNGVLPEEHAPQCYQILLVTGAEKVIFVISDGTEENMVSMEVLPDEAWFARIIAGWEQFAKDLAEYVPPEVIEKPVADTIMQLPAVVINATGALTASNIGEMKPRWDASIAESKTRLATIDIVNGKAIGKFGRATAATLKMKAKEVVDQIATVSDAVRTLEFYAAEFDKMGLDYEKAVMRMEKEEAEAALNKVRTEYAEHVAELQSEVASVRLVVPVVDFAAALKNLRTVESKNNALSTALANSKIAADAIAKDVRAKLAFMGNRQDHAFLFADLQQIIVKPLDDFKLTVTSRIEQHQKAEAEKLEAETSRIRAEEETKARAKVEVEQRAAAEAEAIEVRRKAVALAEQEATLAASKREHEKSLMGEPAVLQTEKPSLSVVELPSKYVRPSEEELLTCWAANFNVPYLTASAWLFELAESMKEAA